MIKEYDPAVDIVILNRNQKHDTIACVSSLQELTYKAIRVVVVDNGSTDGSQAAIRAAFPSVHIIELEENIGCAGGRNVGWQYVLAQDADWVLFLDNDTEVTPNLVCHLVEVTCREQSLGAVGPVITYYDVPDIVWQAGGSIDLRTGEASEFHNGNHVEDIPHVPYDADFIPGCGMMIKACLLMEVGEFDSSYFIYYEDIDWCFRAKRKGYRILVSPTAIVRHKVSRSFGGPTSPQKHYYMTRNRFMFAFRYVPSMYKPWALVWAITQSIGSALRDIAIGRSDLARARVRGMIDFGKGRRGASGRSPRRKDEIGM